MTIENCYQTLGGDYQDVRSRIPSDALIKRFIGAFLSDPSFAALEIAASAGDRKAAFSAAHTLKGVCANLGFGKLYQSASRLMELLRPEADALPDGTAALLEAVRQDYRSAVDTIGAFLSAQ